MLRRRNRRQDIGSPQEASSRYRQGDRYESDHYDAHNVVGVADDLADDDRVRKMAKRRLLSTELEDFMRYLNSPWHIIWRNMIVGLARGLGAIFGATVIVALAIWILKIFIDLPLIGQYANQVRMKVDEITQETRYSDDFSRLQSTMERIDLRLKTQNELLEQVLEGNRSDVDTNDE